MVSSKVFAPLFAIVLATVANASPAAFPEAYPSPEIVVLDNLSRLFPDPDALQKRDCAQTYTVVSGDVCSAIESRFGVSDAQLHALNPAINAGCTSTFFFHSFLLIFAEYFLQIFKSVKSSASVAVEAVEAETPSPQSV
jgi:hypothetical protein